jgi:hypothetical protein
LQAEATFYIDVTEGLKLEVEIKGLFDEKNPEKSKGLIRVTINEEQWVTLYMEESTVYIGDGFTHPAGATNADITWVKLPQMKEGNWLGAQFGKLPNLLKGLFEGMQKNPIVSFLEEKEFAPFIIATKTMGTVEIKPDKSEGAQELDGEYVLTMELSGLSGLLNLIGGFLTGSDDEKDGEKGDFDIGVITDLLEENGLGFLMGVINIVTDTLFNASLEELLSGNSEKDPPDVILTSVNKNNMLQSLNVYYNNAEKETELSFGLKDIKVSANPGTVSYKPAGIKDDTPPDGWLKLSAELEVPDKSEAKLTLDIFVNPAFSVTEADGFRLTNAEAFANATLTYKNVTVKKINLKAQYIGKNNQVRIDLSELFAAMGETDAPGKFYIDFNLDEWFRGLFENAEADEDLTPADNKAALAAEGNDSLFNIVELILGLFNGEELDIMGLLGGAATNVLDFVKTLTDEYNRKADGKPVYEIVVVDDGVARISVEDILSYIAALNGLAKPFDDKYQIEDVNIADIMASLDPNDPELVIAQLLRLINLMDLEEKMTEARLMELIEIYTGIEDVTPAGLVKLLVDVSGIRDKNKGLGFTVAVLYNEKDAVRLALTVDIVGKPDTNPVDLSGDGYVDLLDEEENYGRSIIDVLLLFLEFYENDFVLVP